MTGSVRGRSPCRCSRARASTRSGSTRFGNVPWAVPASLDPGAVDPPSRRPSPLHVTVRWSFGHAKGTLTACLEGRLLRVAHLHAPELIVSPSRTTSVLNSTRLPPSTKYQRFLIAGGPERASIASNSTASSGPFSSPGGTGRPRRCPSHVRVHRGCHRLLHFTEARIGGGLDQVELRRAPRLPCTALDLPPHRADVCAGSATRMSGERDRLLLTGHLLRLVEREGLVGRDVKPSASTSRAHDAPAQADRCRRARRPG